MAPLPGLRGDVQKLGTSIGKLGENMVSGLKTMGTDVVAAGKHGKGAAGAVLTGAKQPLRWGVQGFHNIVVKPVSFAYGKVPWLAWPATVLAAFAVVGGAMRKGAEKRTERQLLEQIQQQQAQYQQPVPQAPANPYQATPEEMAALEARLRTAQNAPEGGHAAAIQARAAAAQTQQQAAGQPVAQL